MLLSNMLSDNQCSILYPIRWFLPSAAQDERALMGLKIDGGGIT